MSRILRTERAIAFDSIVITCNNYRMKLELRRIGNSLGIIVPKVLCEVGAWAKAIIWNLASTAFGPRPSQVHRMSCRMNSRVKLAAEVVSRFTPNLIRAQGIANLSRWRKSGVCQSPPYVGLLPREGGEKTQ